MAMRGASRCISHNPEAKGLKKAAAAKGGRNRKTPKRAKPLTSAIRVGSVGDVLQLLYRTLEDAHNGVIDTDVARAVGYLSGVAVKTAEIADLEGRVVLLEQSARKVLDDLSHTNGR